MIVADTSVLSEPLRRTPNRAVLSWLASVGPDIALTTITAGELLYGAQRLPAGRRRTNLITAIDHLISSAEGRVLGYDEQAARVYASLRVARERAGKATSVEDGMIVAIALANQAAVATRNVSHFTGFGLRVVNPWDSAS